ncbi:MAG TPA: hypothetical protein VLI40_01080 [Gemmatimonadaceae bacterium]|nr:hypothetical protein [Gemmatimonadaceae bacterium]
MSDDLAKDLATAKTNDALALAPHAGVQTVVSAQELSPQGRAQLRASSKSTRLVSSRTTHRDVTPSPAAELPPLPAATTTSEPAASTSDVASAAPAPVDQPAVPTPRPEPVGVSYPSGESSGSTHSGGGFGAIIGAIGGAILRGGVVDGDHCDPRGRHGGTILVNHRGPIFRGTY